MLTDQKLTELEVAVKNNTEVWWFKDLANQLIKEIRFLKKSNHANLTGEWPKKVK